MNKTDQLFIRACKSKDAKKRVCSVYRRFYLLGQPKSHDLARILVRIVDKHLTFTASDLISSLHPDHAWKHGLTADADYWDRVVAVLISKIRLSEVQYFDGLSTPAMFREAS